MLTRIAPALLFLTSTMAMAFAQGAEAEAWKTVTGPLALADVRKGQAWKAPAGLPALGGTVKEVLENDHMKYVLVRLDAPTPGVASLGAFNCGGHHARPAAVAEVAGRAVSF